MLINYQSRFEIDGHFIEIKRCHQKAKKQDLQNIDVNEFVDMMMQFQQLFIGNFNMSQNEKKYINESFTDIYPQFQPNGYQNYQTSQNYGLYGNNMNQNFEFANHFETNINPLRDQNYSKEQLITDFQKCPMSKIIMKNSPERQRADIEGKKKYRDYSDRESYTEILGGLKKTEYKHSFWNLRFNQQIKSTWDFLAGRMKRKSWGI